MGDCGVAKDRGEVVERAVGEVGGVRVAPAECGVAAQVDCFGLGLREADANADVEARGGVRAGLLVRG